ncbi:TIM barrel protein [Roseicyclus sp.]|uniref:hydroxypyruvate isomerase family protein n=1 Tax=Roseicyclus sp. TaxID=1914329 RepID=UPI001BD19D72|nr:TIM barrel protein [Roseicyclus sp.]
MTRFSANLGFLWTDRALPDAIRAAHAAGFDAVECHWPYDIAADDVAAALAETGLPMLGLNTRRGDVAAGENGLAALPGRVDEARAAIDEALTYADAIGAGAVHVMAGKAEGPEARAVFAANLHYACARAAKGGRIILIEPLNPFDAPGYFLNTTAQAANLITEIAAPNLKLMFDCYHVGRTEGDVIARLRALWPIIGHIQFAAVPDRGPPDHGDLDYRAVFAEIAAHAWDKPLGAEYRPTGKTEDSLGWMAEFG